ncbi:thioredoxin [Lachnoclostridium sp. Marseille-P6806]|uniref:thioredoxin n=1 Tax=Lachnoclostridium sp. Marseille-P6806 TaxID=2364793 RepID=UPI00102FAB9B|nr:thioredoxin [Lachnoclostridium sp. Marseille-P6806]
MEYHFNEENFNNEVIKSDKPVMIDFYADWCGPCRMMGPVVAQLADEYDGKVKIGKVNTDEHPQLASSFRVETIPFIAFLKDGKLVDSSIGVVPKSVLEDKLNKLL